MTLDIYPELRLRLLPVTGATGGMTRPFARYAASSGTVSGLDRPAVHPQGFEGSRVMSSVRSLRTTYLERLVRTCGAAKPARRALGAAKPTMTPAGKTA